MITFPLHGYMVTWFVIVALRVQIVVTSNDATRDTTLLSCHIEGADRAEIQTADILLLGLV